MIRPLHPAWRHLVCCWFLPFGFFFFSFSSVTPSLEETCKAHSENRFQIRAMTYSDDYFYLLSSSGQLFVEETATFLGNLKSSPPTLHLSKPFVEKLSPQWPSYPHSIDYANTEIHFGLTKNTDENSGPNSFILRMIEYTKLEVGSARKCYICIYSGFTLNGKEEPLMIGKDSNRCKGLNWNWADYEKLIQLIFWFNDKRTMYYATRPFSSDESEESKGKWRFDSVPNQDVHSDLLKMPFDSRKDVELGEIDKPQSGLYIEKVGLFVVTKGSMMYLLPDPWPSWNDWSTRREAEKWPIKEFVKLTFCKTDAANDTSEKDTAKPKDDAAKGMILYAFIAGIVVVIFGMAVYGVFYWKKKREKQQAIQKAILMLSSVMSSTIHSLNSTFSHLLPKETQVSSTSPVTPTSPAPNKIKKKREKSLKKKAKKKKRKEKCPVKARKSPLARISRATRNVPKCSQVVSPSGASPRSVVSSVLEKSRKKLAVFKRFKRKARNLT